LIVFSEHVEENITHIKHRLSVINHENQLYDSKWNNSFLDIKIN